jgi:predicted lipoprotein with Yx(FWY)xxD motif
MRTARKFRAAAGVLEGMKHTILPSLALVAAALAAACGGSAYGSGASATPAATSTTAAASVKSATGAPGTFLVDAKGRTLYLWVADKGSKSTCSGACAQAWPPLTTTGRPKAGAGAKASLLGTTKRADGTLEVTYAGHPLYSFSGDAQPGQTSGQGSKAFGADWLVVAPNGKAIADEG